MIDRSTNKRKGEPVPIGNEKMKKRHRIRSAGNGKHKPCLLYTSTEETKKEIANIITAYLMNGGQMAQITAASLEDMKDAQIHPDDHRNLIVRVGGFSIHFIELPSYLQNEVMSRYSV